MKLTRKRPGHSQAIVIALAGAVATTLSGCSGEEAKHSYTVPGTVCGAAVNAAELSSFLPPGEHISIKKSNPVTGSSQCDLLVDGHLGARITVEWWKSGTTTYDFAQGQTLADLDHSTEKGRYLYSRTQAFGKVEGCRNAAHKDELLFTAIQPNEPKHEDADAMKKLITSYTRAVGNSRECR
ncbi:MULTISPECIES: hypothetical protein [unclassified Streptomyces]|uniref:hypothetical protein n=1 Tax=unclassified Streptomyces TaxID=2593676 RepID=UPI0033D47064